jgi:hypothetical protein
MARVAPRLGTAEEKVIDPTGENEGAGTSHRGSKRAYREAIAEPSRRRSGKKQAIMPRQVVEVTRREAGGNEASGTTGNVPKKEQDCPNPAVGSLRHCKRTQE